MKKLFVAVLAGLLLTAGMAAAAEESTLQISGDYRFRVDSIKADVHEYTQFDPRAGLLAGYSVNMPAYTAKNSSLITNRFGLNLKADPMEDMVVKARLLMYKVSGHQSSNPVMANFFADRFGATNDGTKGHVPEDSVLRVDYAYATVNNVLDQPMWVSVGRRPSTGGVPSNYRQNQEKQGTAGIPSIMVNYAFDGYTVGYAPDIAALPGAYAKLCGGRGFDSGYKSSFNSVKDTDFLGLNVVPYDTDKLHIEVQYQVGKNIFDYPSDAGVTTNLGDISWYGAVVTSKVGNLNLFASAAVSKTDPNGNLSTIDADRDGTWEPASEPAAGLMFNNGGSTDGVSGNAVFLGARYDMGRTKVGVEYNRGSKNWISMVPADDDIVTSKLGTRGSVYEVYVIQELNRKPVSKKGKAFVKLGYQMYDFEYTGSNNWVGAPVKISDLTQGNPMQAQMLAPVEKATDVYFTFDVQF